MKSNDDKDQKRSTYDGRINVAFYFNHQPQYAIDVIDANNFISYCKLLNRQTHSHTHIDIDINIYFYIHISNHIHIFVVGSASASGSGSDLLP